MLKVPSYALAFFMLWGCAANTSELSDVATTGLEGLKTDRFLDGVESPSPDEADATTNVDGSEAEASDASNNVDAVPVLDPFAPAYDVNLHLVTFDDDLEAPDYDYPRVDSGFFLSGTEFWQKWSGGLNPTYSYQEGSDFGRRCMYASALRFKALMENPPESIIQLKAESNWSGSFFNWNDDYAESTWGDGSSARLWAWRTSLVKWISQTNRDGSCYLPTLDMLEILAVDCMEESEASDGSIQGCRAP